MTAPVILHIDTGRTFRGGQRQLLLLSERLHQRGINQVIACPRDSELNRRITGIEKVELSDLSLIRKLICGTLVRIIDEYGVNIIHAHDSESHTLGIRLKIKHPEVRLVVTRRVIFAPSGTISRRFKYSQHVDQFIAISRAVAEALKNTGVNPDNIAVIPSALDIRSIQSMTSDKSIRTEIPGGCKYLIVSAGALTAEKDFATAIEAVRMASEKIDGIGFVILGDGPQRKRLMAAAADSGLSHVVFAGHREPMAPIFLAADLFLLTSTSEGLNSSAIEAAACGLPLVVSEVGGLPEIAEQEYNGVICEPGRPEGFAEAIVGLLSDDQTRKRMAENSVIKSKQFDLDVTVEKTVEVYKRLLAEPS